MSTARPLATIGRDGKPAVVKGAILAPFFLVIGAMFAGEPLAAALGTTTTLGRVAGATALTVPYLAIVAVLGGRGVVSVNEATISFRGTTVAYDDVAVAVRTDGRMGRLFGTATFDLVVFGGETLTLRYVSDPDALEGHLRERLTPPAEQVAEQAETTPGAAKSDAGTLSTRSQFWDLWRAQARLPDVAVLSSDEVRSALDVDAVEYDRLDGLDLRDVERLADVEEDDVTQSTQHPTP